MSDDERKIECSIHGETSATFICNHLAQGEKLGFNVGYDPDYPDELYPDAWCNQCEAILEEEGEWNDRSEEFADIKVVCADCYHEIRDKNWIEDSDKFHELICSSFEYLEDMQNSFMTTYKIGSYDHWDWYQEDGKLIFSNEGTPVLEVDIDFVGSYSNKSNTWMWAWANSSFTDNIKMSSREIRVLGEELGYQKLASALWPATPEDGWEMTAIMAAKFGSIGAYRTPTDSGFVYMVAKGAKWVNKSKEAKILSFFKWDK